MLGGTRQLRKAARVVSDEGIPVNARIAEAMLAFWSACGFQDEWPEELRGRAEAIRWLVARGGTFNRTTNTIDDSTLTELQIALRELATKAETVRGP